MNHPIGITGSVTPFLSFALVFTLAGSIAGSGCQKTQELPENFVKLEIEGHELAVEIAADNPSRGLGLMHREELPEQSAMLFIYSRKQLMSFYMRNTLIPLSIAFLGDDGMILQIRDMKPMDETSIRSKHEVRYALEVNKGWFTRAKVGVGDSFSDFQEIAGSIQAR